MNQSQQKPADNRPLNLDELQMPFFRNMLEAMERLLQAYPQLYLHPGKRWEYGWALQRAGPVAGAAVLDVGCGHSVFPVYLARQGGHVTACDLDIPRIGDCEKLRFVRADMTRLPFAENVFDAVFCISVIEHLEPPDRAAALTQMRRVLRPGGGLLLTTDFYEDADAELWYRGPDRQFKVDWHVFDRSSFQQTILNAEGFRVDGAVDMAVDWDMVKPQMRQFHGYPYTSMAVKLIKI